MRDWEKKLSKKAKELVNDQFYMLVSEDFDDEKEVLVRAGQLTKKAVEDEGLMEGVVEIIFEYEGDELSERLESELKIWLDENNEE